MKNLTKIKFSDKEISEIAEQLDCGCKAYYNLATKEFTFLPDIDNSFGDIPDEFVKAFKRIKKQWDDYIEFTKMESKDSFKVMDDFIDEVNDKRLQEQLITALNKPKPFSHFKFQIDNSGKYRQQWFDYKHHRMIEWVKNQVDKHNNLVEFRTNNSDKEEE